jgi:hypothetical protein
VPSAGGVAGGVVAAGFLSSSSSLGGGVTVGVGLLGAGVVASFMNWENDLSFFIWLIYKKGRFNTGLVN